MRHTIDLAPDQVVRIGEAITIMLAKRPFRVTIGEVHLAIGAPPEVFIARGEASEAEKKRWRDRRDDRGEDKAGRRT